MERKSLQLGVFCAVSAHLIWGLLLFYWKPLKNVSAFEILAWRLAGCMFLSWILILLRKRKFPFAMFNPRFLGLLGLGAILISLNWITYLWAVATERVVEASIGYYFIPLVNVVLGMIFFLEKLGKIRFLAMVPASIAVLLMTLSTSSLPWISLVLAFSFAFYGLVLKKMPDTFDNLEVLALVVSIPGLIAITYLIRQGLTGEGHFLNDGWLPSLLLGMAGPMTFLPLWLFGMGARRLPLGLLGFIQYVGPTLMLLISTLIFKEPIDIFKGLALVFIIMALTLYSSTFKQG